MILMIDNYDSFTYNLVAMFRQAGKSVDIKMNDDPDLMKEDLSVYEGIVISPGPQEPSQAGYIVQVIEKYYNQCPILGICLGHQAIGQAFGEKVVKADRLYHGKKDQMRHLNNQLFKSVNKVFEAVRYHSLVVEYPLLSDKLEPLAYSQSDHSLMALKHKDYPVYGLQFHPESYETKEGTIMINNFIAIMDEKQMEDLAQKMIRGHLEETESIELLNTINEQGIGEKEMISFSNALKACSNIPKVSINHLTDTCGTGGDQLHTFNISTTQSLVLAACGLPIAKHGNRSVSSSCGSADVLEALGVKIDLSPDQALVVLEKIGIVFLFAQSVHPMMKNVMPIRKQIKGPTVFNTIGPLSNPMMLENQVIGVYKPNLMDPMLSVMVKSGVKNPMVIHGFGGMDELSLEGVNRIGKIVNGQRLYEEMNPLDYGFNKVPNTALRGGDAQINSQLVLSVLNGENTPYKDSVILNAGYSLYYFKGLKTVEEGIQMAKIAIDSGKALAKLNELIAVSQAVAK